MLKPKGRILYSEPVVLTGPITNEEVALRSSSGYFVFVPLGVNEEWLEGTGFSLIRKEDVTENVVRGSRRWHESRQRHCVDSVKIEGEERFEGLQTFFTTVDRLAIERGLSRFVYVAEKQIMQVVPNSKQLHITRRTTSRTHLQGPLQSHVWRNI